MAVTGVNNYSNTYTNAYTSNVQRKDTKETTEKQAVEQTEAVKTGTTRKTVADELKYLSEKYKDYNFYMGTYQPGTKFGTSDKTNVMIDSQFLKKMANDPELEKEYEKEIAALKDLDQQMKMSYARQGWRCECGTIIDKNGEMSGWTVVTKDPKAKSFLQKMSEKSEEIRQKQMEKSKDAERDELSYLSKLFDDYSFVSANYSQGMKYGKSNTTNVAISPQFLTKMANNTELEAEYIKEIGNMRELDEQFARGQAARGWKVVARGWAIDKDGGISCWSITTKDPKAKSFLQKMSDKSEEIRQKQMEKAKEAKEEQEVFVMKKYKNASQKNSINLSV